MMVFLPQAAVEENYVKCEDCLDTSNLSTNVICNRCTKFLFKFDLIRFLLFLGSILGIGFIIGYYHHNWVASVYVSILVIAYSLVTLRSESIVLPRSLFMMFITLPIVFISLQGDLGIPFFRESSYALYALAILSLSGYYVGAWVKSCNERGVSLVIGSTAISLTLFVVAVLTIVLVELLGVEDTWNLIEGPYFPPISVGQVSSYLVKVIDVRIITGSVAFAGVLAVAAIEFLKRPFPSAENLFNPQTNIKLIPPPGSVGLAGALLVPAIVAVNIGLSFYKIVTESIKMLANGVKITAELILKCLRNYAFEIGNVVRNTIVVLKSTAYLFLKGYLLPLGLYFAIAVHANVLIINISHYIHSGVLINPLWVLGMHALLAIIESWFLFWALTGHHLRPIVRSVTTNNVAFTFIILVCVFISSFFLSLSPYLIDQLPFKKLSFKGAWPFIEVGPFQAISFLVLIAFGVGGGAWQYFSGRLGSNRDSGATR
jgi:hypothetical protein